MTHTNWDIFSTAWPKSLHRYLQAIWIFVIFHVERTFMAMTGEICGKYFKKKTENQKTLLKTA